MSQRAKISLTGEIVLEWLKKHPNLPTHQLSRMIYNADDNYKVFNNIEAVRTRIRYYRGAQGDERRKYVSTKKHFRPFKTITHEQV